MACRMKAASLRQNLRKPQCNYNDEDDGFWTMETSSGSLQPDSSSNSTWTALDGSIFRSTGWYSLTIQVTICILK